jgi:hypothetical protein
MKPILFTLLFLVFLHASHAQLTITSGSQLSFSGDAQLILNNTDLVNNGSFTAGTGKISFTGNSNSAISGSQNIQFYDLQISKSAGNSVLLQRPIGIDGQISFSSGFLDLNNYDVDLGSTGSLNGESESGRIIGSSGGQVIFNTTLNMPSSANPGNLGAIITSAQNLGNIIIKRGHQPQTIGSTGSSILRYYEITPANNTGLNAAIRFQYFDGELNGQDENTLLFWEKTAVQNWTILGFDSRNTTQRNYVEKTAIPSLDQFTLSSETNSPLPVHFILFNVQCNGNNVSVAWKTAEELNSHYYTVERSADAVEWKALSNIPAAGNTASDHDYSFTDNAATGNAYYRIAEYDIDGHVQYTKILPANCNSREVFRIWPNPVNDLLMINISGVSPSPVIIKVFDGKGSLVRQETATVLSGNNLLTLNMTGLAKAVYFLEITYNRQTRTEPIIKQ